MDRMRRIAKEKKGSSIIEVIVSFLVFTITLGFMITALTVTSRQVARTRQAGHDRAVAKESLLLEPDKRKGRIVISQDGTEVSAGKIHIYENREGEPTVYRFAW